MPVNIELPCGCVTVVDDEDVDLVEGYRWRLTRERRKWKHGKLDKRYVHAPTSRTYILLHRLILNAPDGVLVDHMDGNPLNNVKSNLRLTDAAGNARNSRGSGKSGFKGVTYHRQLGKWQAAIQVRQQPRYLGVFNTPEEAAHVYDRAAREAYGEFAWLNFPMAVRQ